VLKSRDDPTKELSGGGGEDDIVDIEQQVGNIRTMLVDEQRRVSLRFSEPHKQKISGKPAVLGTGGLLQSIEGLVELTNKVRMSRVLETSRLHRVDCLDQSAVQKSILHIELVDGPAIGESQGEHSPNSSRLHDRTERF